MNQILMTQIFIKPIINTGLFLGMMIFGFFFNIFLKVYMNHEYPSPQSYLIDNKGSLICLAIVAHIMLFVVYLLHLSSCQSVYYTYTHEIPIKQYKISLGKNIGIKLSDNKTVYFQIKNMSNSDIRYYITENDSCRLWKNANSDTIYLTRDGYQQACIMCPYYEPSIKF